MYSLNLILWLGVHFTNFMVYIPIILKLVQK